MEFPESLTCRTETTTDGSSVHYQTSNTIKRGQSLQFRKLRHKLLNSFHFSRSACRKARPVRNSSALHPLHEADSRHRYCQHNSDSGHCWGVLHLLQDVSRVTNNNIVICKTQIGDPEKQSSLPTSAWNRLPLTTSCAHLLCIACVSISAT